MCVDLGKLMSVCNVNKKEKTSKKRRKKNKKQPN